MRKLPILALSAALAGCAFQRAETARDAQAQMIGMPKEQVLACMGVPSNQAAEGATEVWGYNSGRQGGSARASSRFCNVNVVFSNGVVSTVNYTGRTGGLLTADEQCAYAVSPCVKRR